MGGKYIREDMTGKQVGRWSVITKQGATRNGMMYLCRCTCGNERSISTAQLHWGKTKSCGCLRDELHSLALAGKRIGKLTVNRLVTPSPLRSKGNCWECTCECGALVFRTAGMLAVAERNNNVSCCDSCKQGKYKTGTGKHDYVKEYKLWEKAKVRATRIGVPFNLDVEDVVIPEVCPLLGILIESNNRGRWEESSPSLDRKLPSLGYVKGNVWVISYRANRIKNDATLEELEMIARRLRDESERIGTVAQ